jgi:DNA polymerase-3 subunit alpha
VPHADFVHLRVHTAYSLSEGAIKADKLPSLARADGMPAVAMTDSGNLFGALEFSQAAVAAGVQPIIGCQLMVVRAGDDRRPVEPVVVLAQDQQGLANLRQLSSRSFLESPPGTKPQIEFDVLAEHAAGLFLLTGGPAGSIARLVAEGKRADAASLLARFCEAFPDRVAIELHRHGGATDRAVESVLLDLADERQAPLVATNDCYFPKPEMFEAHDALLCIAEGRQVAERDRRRVTPDHWFKPASAMRALFADLLDACDNTLAIARCCAVRVEARSPMLPTFPKAASGVSEADLLRAMAVEGLERRLSSREADPSRAAEYRARLEYELGVIIAMGFAGYFLIVADFIQWAKAAAIPVGPGRGSGAGSVVAWALTITNMDPLRFGLLFERFLNPERVSMPDFDIDFCQDRRDEVIAYVRQEYGSDRVAQIITFGKLQARAAVRDVGRVLGLPFGRVNKVAELIPNNPAKPLTLQQALDQEPRLQAMREDDEAVRRLIEIALQLEGLYRHASTHAAGVVIGDRPLVDLVPLYKDPRSDYLVTQYSMKHVEAAGLVKFDFLGLTTLTILQRACGYLSRLSIDVDLETLPLDDPATFEMLQRGDAGGVFQFEGQGMRDVLRQMRPDRFEDLIAAVALYRPGPMANIPDYCQRKHGQPWTAPHPELTEILSETYGIMVYQEQVMQIAQKMGGYSLGAADLLRRAMGKKIRAEMDAQRETFERGATARGIAAEKATEVFDLMAKFADYGFNKSHAAAYALVAYQTAWMKANHPVAFIAACMSLALGNVDKLAALKQEADRMGIRILPPDINRSQADFSLERTDDGGLAIRYALAAIKRVGRGAMESIVASRQDRPFADIAEFAARVDPRQLNRVQLENLVRAGAFDALDANRARLFASADTILRTAQVRAESRTSGQVGLFQDDRPEPIVLAKVPDWSPIERLEFEAEAVGLHLTEHPLDAYAGVLRRWGVASSRDLEARARAGGGRVKLAGKVVSLKERNTRTGSRMAWIRFSDASGSYEVTFFSETLSRVREALTVGSMALVTADLRAEGETVRITAQDARRLDEAAAESAADLRVWLARPDAIDTLAVMLGREAGGKGVITLLPRVAGPVDVEVRLSKRYNATPRLAQALKALPGVERVELT